MVLKFSVKRIRRLIAVRNQAFLQRVKFCGYQEGIRKKQLLNHRNWERNNKSFLNTPYSSLLFS
jgi:hypothetical protein